MENMYFRPEWTCGRYDKEKQVALMYNLIEGMSYLFEDYSAEVVGEILLTDKNGQVSIDEVSLNTLIDKESLEPFFTELVQIGLLVMEIPTTQKIDIYRKKIGTKRKEHPPIISVIEQTEKEELPQNISSAEKDYFDKVGGITNVMFELTYNCSEQCIHCYNPGATRNDQEVNKRNDRIELELKDYERIIDELYDLGLTKVCLSGGDPFSKAIVWDIINYLYKKGVATDIFTNGQSIVKDVKRLAKYYPTLVGISIYSGIAEDHDYITRVKGSWERSMNVVKQLSDLGIPMNLKCCIMRSNAKSYHLVKEIAKKYGAVPQFDIKVINSLEGDKCASNYLRLSKEILELVLQDNAISQYVGKEKLNYGGQALPKEIICKSYCITPEGNVQVCCAFPSSVGNLKEKTFVEILQHSKELAYWNSIKLEDYEECGQHSYCNFCKMCPGINFAETGNPLKPAETNCYIAKIRSELAEKLKQGHDPLNAKSIQECLSSVSIPLLNIKREIRNNYRNEKLTVGG